MLEKRAIAERDRCEIKAEIVVREKDVRIPCLIIDISEQGARLQVADDAAVPDSFELAVPVAADIVDRRAAEVRWRRETMVGLRFRSC